MCVPGSAVLVGWKGSNNARERNFSRFLHVRAGSNWLRKLPNPGGRNLAQAACKYLPISSMKLNSFGGDRHSEQCSGFQVLGQCVSVKLRMCLILQLPGVGHPF